MDVVVLGGDEDAVHARGIEQSCRNESTNGLEKGTVVQEPASDITMYPSSVAVKPTGK